MLTVAVLASSGMVLGATYMLRFARAAVFGGEAGEWTAFADLRLRETVPYAALLAVVLWIGVAPASLMARVEGIASGISELALAHGTASRQAALATEGSPHAR
jgi:NADH-quinone oxidoreductase subunit M